MIKRFLKRTHYSATKLIDTSVSVVSVLLFSSFRVNKTMRECIEKYKKFNECVVMGNGPSITTLLEKKNSDLVNKDIFAVNYFCLTSYFDSVKPNFYVMLDPNLFLDDLSVDGNMQVIELVNKFNEITWEMVVFIPVKFKNSKLVESFSNKKLIVVPFNSTPVKGLKMIENMLFESNLGMPLPQTVINAVIFLAINLKFDIINLYGVEQSWLKYLHVNNDNQVNVRLEHFYGGSDSLGRHSTLNTLSAFLYTQAACFESHMRLQEYARYSGERIFNHTPGSYIDAYERVG